MTPEEWLQSNAFTCPYGLGRFSNQQCEENRRKAQENIISYQSAGNLTPCETCTTGNKKIVIQYPIKEKKKAIDIEKNETVYNGLQNQIKELIKVGKKKIRKCKKCGKEKPHHGKGYCASCYGKEVRIKKMNFEIEPIINKLKKGKHKGEVLEVKDKSEHDEIGSVWFPPGASVKNGIKYQPQFVDTSCFSNKSEDADNIKYHEMIYFESPAMKELYKKLQQKAEKELRTIENQILWELKKLLEVE